MMLIMGYNFALHISVASIAIDFVLAVASLLTGTSSSNCAFAVDCALDVFSNAILVWRFYGDSCKRHHRGYGHCRPSPTTRLTASRPNSYQTLSFSDRNNNEEAVRESANHRKELVACIGLGIMFIVSGCIVIAKSGVDLAMSESIDDLQPDVSTSGDVLSESLIGLHLN